MGEGMVKGGASFVLSSTLFLVLFSVMQMQRNWLASSQLSTIFSGYLGSILFVLSLTAIGSLEKVVFGPRHAAKLFPEVVICILIAMFAVSTIHRVCITTCFLFSLVALYYVNELSKQEYPVVNPAATVVTTKKRK